MQKNTFTKLISIVLVMVVTLSLVTNTGDVEAAGKKVTTKAFAGMMTDVIKKCDSTLVKKWKSVAKIALKDKKKIERDDAELILYEAACVLGIGRKGGYFWHEYLDATVAGGIEENGLGFTPRKELFKNSEKMPPYEAQFDQGYCFSYADAAFLYAMGLSSPSEPTPFFEDPLVNGGYSASISKKEAKNAANRLYQKYLYENEGSFDINNYETNWKDPKLASALKQKDAILNSKTSIKKSDTFIQGETYTGTAYYVSNNGDDANSGTSPETQWKTMEKVTQTKLQFGDAVFFERGGVWNGRLIMQDGVTYSAYGTGDKPIWTGSPIGIADESKWELFGTTTDGGKIWKYYERVRDVGTVLLDGHIVARKYYPIWDGKKYLTSDSNQEFDLKKNLSADLMFCPVLDLKDKGEPPFDLKDENIGGEPYLRCDKGNPGAVYSDIWFAMGADRITTSDGGYNTIDNISYRYFCSSGMDCNCHEHIIFQYCEASWCGCGISEYEKVDGKYYVGVSGGGMLLFGCHVIGRDNYIHDCENKGITVVINGNGHATLERKDVLAENNVVERCGMSTWMMTEFVPKGKSFVFEDIRIKNNYLIHGGRGWRSHNLNWIGNWRGTFGCQCGGIYASTIRKTGEVVYEGNLIYEPEGLTISVLSGKDI